MLQVKFDFRLKYFKPSLILNICCLLALEDKEIGNYPRLHQNLLEIKFDL